MNISTIVKNTLRFAGIVAVAASYRCSDGPKFDRASQPEKSYDIPLEQEVATKDWGLNSVWAPTTLYEGKNGHLIGRWTKNGLETTLEADSLGYKAFTSPSEGSHEWDPSNKQKPITVDIDSVGVRLNFADGYKMFVPSKETGAYHLGMDLTGVYLGKSGQHF